MRISLFKINNAMNVMTLSLRGAERYGKSLSLRGAERRGNLINLMESPHRFALGSAHPGDDTAIIGLIR